MELNRKAISPVVATALLLVVAVVAVVGFQTWFNTYQSGLNAKVEQQSNSGSALTVERLETTGDVYVKNGGTTDITVSNSKITYGTNSTTVAGCTNTSQTANASTVVTIGHGCSSALTSGTSYQVVLTTTDGVFTSTQLAR